MIKVKNLTKEFVKYEKEKGLKGMLKAFFNAKKVIKKAVDDISFDIKEGEIIGYIGANGAGKSTTIKMLTGILHPTSGQILIDGLDPVTNRIANAKNIGVVFGQRTVLWWDLPLQESFSILKEIYEISDADFEERMTFFNDILEINSFIKSPVRTLSLGQRMRADIAASLLHNPKILYLDEPTIGLDVMAKEKMRDAIRTMNQKFNTTVVLTTHDLDDIEELCERILMIDEGKIIFDGPLEDIKKSFGNYKTIKFHLKEKGFEDIDFGQELASAIDFQINDDIAIVKVDRNKTSVTEVIKFVLDKITISDIDISDIDIEEVVKKIYQKGEL